MRSQSVHDRSTSSSTLFSSADLTISKIRFFHSFFCSCRRNKRQKENSQFPCQSDIHSIWCSWISRYLYSLRRLESIEGIMQMSFSLLFTTSLPSCHEPVRPRPVPLSFIEQVHFSPRFLVRQLSPAAPQERKLHFVRLKQSHLCDPSRYSPLYHFSKVRCRSSVSFCSYLENVPRTRPICHDDKFMSSSNWILRLWRESTQRQTEKGTARDSANCDHFKVFSDNKKTRLGLRAGWDGNKRDNKRTQWGRGCSDVIGRRVRSVPTDGLDGPLQGNFTGTLFFCPAKTFFLSLSSRRCFAFYSGNHPSPTRALVSSCLVWHISTHWDFPHYRVDSCHLDSGMRWTNRDDLKPISRLGQ